MKALLSHSRELLEESGNLGFTPLTVAAIFWGNSYELIQFLLSAGASITASNAYDRKAFDYCGRYGYQPDQPCNDILLELFKTRLLEKRKEVALHGLFQSSAFSGPEFSSRCSKYFWMNRSRSTGGWMKLPLGNMAMPKFHSFLDSFDADLFSKRDTSGMLPLHVALGVGPPMGSFRAHHSDQRARDYASMQFLKYLVEKDCTSLDVADHAGRLPIHIACRSHIFNNLENIQLLVDQGGVSTVSSPDQSGALALHALCDASDPSLEAVRYLMKVYPLALSVPTRAGKTPFATAATNSSASVTVLYEVLRANPEVVSELIS